MAAPSPILHVVLVAALAGCAAPPVGEDDTDVVAAHVLFGFPVQEPERITELIGVDHKPGPGAGGDLLGRADCLDYLGRGFPHCYDGHDGSDFTLGGGFDSMDDGSATVIAAADGVVLSTHDGEYDRCRADISVDGGISCDGHPPVAANSVEITHPDGSTSRYWHLASGSVVVTVGDAVRRGDSLGLIGSSGVSSFPHLHFEVQLPGGAVVDPYAGPESQDDSWWCTQRGPDELPGACE